MTTLRFFYASLFTFLSMLPAWGQPPRQIVPGVWVRKGSQPLIPGSDARENIIIVEMKDYLVVIDSGMKETARQVQADCRALSSKPVRYVFLTHHHFDHVAGNSIWTAAGVTTLAFPGLNEELKRNPGGFEPARRVLQDTSFVLDDGTRHLEFYSWGWAHTKGDGVAYLPKEKVLCTGDVVVNGPYNSIFDSNLRNWPGVIRQLEVLNVRVVLPGHGEPASKDVLRGQREFLESLSARVQAAINAGQKLEDLVEMQDGKLGQCRFMLPRSVDNWGNPPSGFQVKSVYEQLSH